MYFRLVLIVLSVLGWSQALLTGRCASAEAGELCAISGRIVSDEGAYHGWVVFDGNDGTIVDICHCQPDLPPGARIVKHEGYIFPGLIDTHNHCHYNSVPMWRSGRLYNNRYEWQAEAEYQQEVSGPYHAIEDAGLWDQSLKYGEIRALIGGTTMIEGSDDIDPDHLVRNLDWEWGAFSYVPDVSRFTVLCG